MSQIMEKFDVLKKLNDEFKQRVKILYVFEDFLKGYNVFKYMPYKAKPRMAH